MQSSSEQPLVGEEHCVMTLITAAKETSTHTIFVIVLGSRTSKLVRDSKTLKEGLVKHIITHYKVK